MGERIMKKTIAQIKEFMKDNSLEHICSKLLKVVNKKIDKTLLTKIYCMSEEFRLSVFCYQNGVLANVFGKTISYDIVSMSKLFRNEIACPNIETIEKFSIFKEAYSVIDKHIQLTGKQAYERMEYFGIEQLAKQRIEVKVHKQFTEILCTDIYFKTVKFVFISNRLYSVYVDPNEHTYLGVYDFAKMSTFFSTWYFSKIRTTKLKQDNAYHNGYSPNSK
jgi:hypothetical protein